MLNQSTQVPGPIVPTSTIQLQKEPVYENGNHLAIASPPITRSPSPLNVKLGTMGMKSSSQCSKPTIAPSPVQLSSPSICSALNPLPSSTIPKNDNNSHFSSSDGLGKRDKCAVNNNRSGVVNINSSGMATNSTIPKLTIDVALGPSKPKQKPTTLSADTPNLIILNTPPSPATTPSASVEKGVGSNKRNLSPRQQAEPVINIGQGNTLTPTYFSSTTSSALKPSPATSPLVALKRHPGTKTPTSDPVSPNIPTHHELDRRHSDSTNWPNLPDSPKVFTSASTSSATSSMTSASTTEASDSQDSPLLHRPKLSQNGKELTIGKNNHTYQNTNLITTGKTLMKS